MNAGYSSLQILLHWLVAALVLVQYATGGSIERTHHAVHSGIAPDPLDVLEHTVHNGSGMVIGVLMVLRLILAWRARHLARIEVAKGLAERAAYVMHVGLYTALLLQAASGFVASYLTFSVAPVHKIVATAIFVMLVAHVGAALIHASRRDGTIVRIFIPRARQ